MLCALKLLWLCANACAALPVLVLCILRFPSSTFTEAQRLGKLKARCTHQRKYGTARTRCYTIYSYSGTRWCKHFLSFTVVEGNGMMSFSLYFAKDSWHFRVSKSSSAHWFHALVCLEELDGCMSKLWNRKTQSCWQACHCLHGSHDSGTWHLETKTGNASFRTWRNADHVLQLHSQKERTSKCRTKQWTTTICVHIYISWIYLNLNLVIPWTRISVSWARRQIWCKQNMCFLFAHCLRISFFVKEAISRWKEPPSFERPLEPCVWQMVLQLFVCHRKNLAGKI